MAVIVHLHHSSGFWMQVTMIYSKFQNPFLMLLHLLCCHWICPTTKLLTLKVNPLENYQGYKSWKFHIIRFFWNHTNIIVDLTLRLFLNLVYIYRLMIFRKTQFDNLQEFKYLICHIITLMCFSLVSFQVNCSFILTIDKNNCYSFDELLKIRDGPWPDPSILLTCCK